MVVKVEMEIILRIKTPAMKFVLNQWAKMHVSCLRFPAPVRATTQDMRTMLKQSLANLLPMVAVMEITIGMSQRMNVKQFAQKMILKLLLS